MIEVRGLVKKYGSLTAVNGIDLSIPQGQIYGFLGPNGSGKTSTINMLLGLSRPTNGEIKIFGEQYNQSKLDLHYRIGVVPERQHTEIWPWLTANDYLKFFADLYLLENPGKRIEELLEKVNLGHVQNKRIKGFSRGMLRKLGIVRALLHRPDILFLDEPISGLDPMGIKQIRDLFLEENNRGCTIFISSHLLSEVEKICHQIAIIEKGVILYEGKMSKILSSLAEYKKYQIEVEEIPAALSVAVSKLPFVVSSRFSDNTIYLEVDNKQDYRKIISKFFIDQNLIPLSIKEDEATLEEAFITITQNMAKKIGTGKNNI